MGIEIKHEDTWLQEEERLKHAGELMDLALERLAKVPQLAEALMQAYLKQHSEPLSTGAVRFEIEGETFFVIHSTKYGEKFLDILKNKYPSNDGDPASETIKIQLMLERGLQAKVHGVFQYQRIEFDSDKSRLSTCTLGAEEAIRKFIEENFPA